ncbi:MAG: hypothetical protein ACR2MY_08500 [Candidatus Dormibacteria bacterium]
MIKATPNTSAAPPSFGISVLVGIGVLAALFIGIGSLRRRRQPPG